MLYGFSNPQFFLLITTGKLQLRDKRSGIKNIINNFMNSNCPMGCVHCLNDSAEEAQERAEARERQAEDDENFRDRLSEREAENL